MTAIHFQEGFSGETVHVKMVNRPALQLTLHTRMQLGLAAIEEVSGEPGDQLMFSLVGSEESDSIAVPDHGRCVLVNLVNGKLVVTSTDNQPGYV